ncbi:metalloprotease [Thermococcus profundus]|uniref:Metalloprotease n=1 Tax=Thermococcus profundus TaxID=49899 RepID=A0A2Z2ML29_THEPR|nr:M67 family metallopeptidase [Thermococcus profundus]ASJ02668.1 metalloprotease [Thermococcus profundus]
MRLVIRRDDLVGIIKSAGESEGEICGFLLGRIEGSAVFVEEVRGTRNKLNSPIAFEIDPLETAEVLDEAEGKGLEVVGVFHSHLECPPVPSGKDIEGMDLWRNVWLIVTPSGGFQAWILENGEVKEVRVETR